MPGKIHDEEHKTLNLIREWNFHALRGDIED